MHYEVSNFSKPGYMSQHNSSYWKDEKYLGVGPSAHSYNGTTRQYNISNNYHYVKAIQSGRVPATSETLNRADKINDWILTTLRTSWGTDLKKLRNQHHYDLLMVHSGYVNNLVERKLAIVHNDALILTRKGRLLADRIASDLFTSLPS
jgi:oxygen-independent coproporphyrinogen-3 oxidase